MYKITGISSNYNQLLGLSLHKVSNITLGLHYYATQQSWMYDVQYEDFSIKNQRVHISYNMLDKYKNIIPFGIFVKSLDGGEPLYLEDFTYPRIEMYLLTAEEAQSIHTMNYRRWVND